MFTELKLLPPDSLLGLTKLFADDPRARKIDLGVGVFRTADNKTPILDAVKLAERRIIERETSKVYTPPEGAPGFPEAIAHLLFGADHPAVREGRVAAIQSVGGCAALRLGAELLKRAGARTIYMGSPTWPNHQPLLSAAGHAIKMIPYYDAAKRQIDFEGFYAEVQTLGREDVLLVHGACHNPTGADLNGEQIDAVIKAAERQGFLPFIDIAYHGFANGLDADAMIAREMARRLPEVVISYSCSKNFGLYRERAGALLVVGATAERAQTLRSHVLALARGIYSLPPAHGAIIVAEILSSPELEKMWRDELAVMRDAVKESRRLLVRTAAEMQMTGFDHIEKQNGMFSLLPLDEAQVLEARSRHGVYMAGSGRINLCGVNAGNVGHLCEAIRDVMRG